MQRSTIILILLVCTQLLSAQTIQEGVIHVKLKREYANLISARRGPASFGISSLDMVGKQVGTISVARVYKPAGRFEKAHQKYGLHLWYEVRFDNQKSVKEVIELFRATATCTEVTHVATYQHETGYKSPRVVGSAAAPLPGRTNDPKFLEQWHYENLGQTGGLEGADISLPQAWALQTGTPNVVVAVIDAGIDIRHPDLTGALWVNSGEVADNKIDDDLNGYIDDINGYGFGDDTAKIVAHLHGTHVGGTIGAVTNNGIGVAGVAGGSGTADGVRLMSLAAFGEYDVGGFENAMVYAADMGAVISQNSWSGGGRSIEDAINYFIERAGFDNSEDNFELNIQTGPMAGGLVFFAAGNLWSSNPADGYPGSYAPVVAVSATNHSDEKAFFSNFGGWVDIAAPGEDILSSIPDESYDLLSGTSMACPHVSGVAALLVSHFQRQGLTAAEIKNRLLSATDNVDPFNYAEFRGLLGTGRLNAHRALTDPFTEDDEALPPIADLNVSSTGYYSMQVSWTNPGQANFADRVNYYDLRFSTTPITEANFHEAIPAVSMPHPGAPGGQESFTISNLVQEATYYFAVKSYDLSGNASLMSNVPSSETTTPPVVSAFPYFNDFERDAIGWSNESLYVDGWKLATPNTLFIPSAYSGQKCWATNPEIPWYENGSQYHLYSPVFDFSSFTTEPIISFALIYSIEPDFDILRLQWSNDDGRTWLDVPLTESQNGYNCFNCSEAFPEAIGWHSMSSWTAFVGRLTGMMGQDHVQFRLAFHTDAGVTLDGVAIDDFGIAERVMDVSVSSAVGPGSRINLTNEEPVVLTLMNAFSGDVIQEVEISYAVQGPLTYTVTEILSNLDWAAGTEIELTKNLDFSAPGLYDVQLAVTTPGDQFNANNNAQLKVSHLIAVSTFPYVNNFEAEPTDWISETIGGAGPGWEWGKPDKKTIRSAYSGEKVWVTALADQYQPLHVYGLYSPVFDFSDLTEDPLLSFSMIFKIDLHQHTENVMLGDIAHLQFSTDGNETWQEVPMVDARNGYNCLGCTRTFFKKNGWNNISGGLQNPMWLDFATKLEGFRGLEQVRFRIMLETDNEFEQEGIAIDDFKVTGSLLPQTITFIPPAELTYGDPALTLQATATSGLPVLFFANNAEVATIAGSMLTTTGGGTTVITAHQPGNGVYAAAETIVMPLEVKRATQVIEFDPLVDVYFPDTENFTLTGSTSSLLDVTYSSSDPTVAEVAFDFVVIYGTGTTFITASQEGNENYEPAESVTQALTVRLVMGTEADELESMSVYPNPTIDKAYVSGAMLKEKVTVSVYNAMGQLQSSTISAGVKDELHTIDLRWLPSGLYLVTIKSSRGEVTRRITKYQE